MQSNNIEIEYPMHIVLIDGPPAGISNARNS